MTTMTANLSDLTCEVPAHDEDGLAVTLTIQVIADEDGDGYLIEVIEDGDAIDFDTAETLAAAAEKVKQFAMQLATEDRRRELGRIRDQRQYRRECLLGAAEEMTGEDAQAVKLLAKLIAGGRGAIAAGVLSRVL